MTCCKEIKWKLLSFSLFNLFPHSCHSFDNRMCSKFTLTSLQYTLVYTLTHTHTTCPQCYPSYHVSYRGMKTMLHLLIIMGNKISLNNQSHHWHDYRDWLMWMEYREREEGWTTGRFKRFTNHFMTCASLSFGHEIHSDDFKIHSQPQMWPTTRGKVSYNNDDKMMMTRVGPGNCAPSSQNGFTCSTKWKLERHFIGWQLIVQQFISVGRIDVS